MNANVNNSVNANNSNINAMEANNMEFVCSVCGGKHIIARPKTEPTVKVVDNIVFVEGGVTEHLVAKEEQISLAIARNLDKLPEEVLEALRGTTVYDNLLELAASIEEEGYIQRPEIVKRFLVKRALELVLKDGAMAEYLNRGGYRYALKVMRYELGLMAHMEEEADAEALEECRMIWTDEVFVKAMTHWCAELDKLPGKKRLIHKCKGRKYVKVSHSGVNVGMGVFLNEWDEFVNRFRSIISRFCEAEYYSDKLFIFDRFVMECRKMHWTPSQSKAFENAFRAAGGYYTLKDLILFEGVKLDDELYHTQLEWLQIRYDERCGKGGCNVTTEGYKMFGYLKSVLEKSSFDFEAAKQKWNEASQARREARRNHERRSRN